MGDWINYAEHKPDAAGVYQWRVPSLPCEGMFVTFFCHMRERGAGCKSVLSPLFDYWDGYRVIVPDGTQWRTVEAPPEIKWSQYADVTPENVALDPCPFCRRVPAWHGEWRASDGGLFVAGEPYRFNEWRVGCCAWARSPRFSDPRKLAEARRNLLREPRP